MTIKRLNKEDIQEIEEAEFQFSDRKYCAREYVDLKSLYRNHTFLTENLMLHEEMF